MPTFNIRAQRIVNHRAIVVAMDAEEALEKYISEAWAWDQVETQQLLKASIHITKDPCSDADQSSR